MANIKSVYPDFITVDEALKMKGSDLMELQTRHFNEMVVKRTNAKYFVKAENFTFTEEDGTEHIDMIGAVGVQTVGNNNMYVWEQIKKVVESKQFTMGAIGIHNISAALGKACALISPGGKLDKVQFGYSGAEATELSLSLARIYWADQTVKTRFLSTLGAYHGKHTGARSVTKESWKTGLNGIPDNVDYVEFGDAAALEDALKKGCYMAFIVEPIQGENGVFVPPDGYITKVRELCTKYDTLWIADEIQSGMGRTGKWWAVDWENQVPDILQFAKGASGGLIPMGGIMASTALYNKAYLTKYASHTTQTYHSNQISSTAMLAAIQFIIENDLLDNCIKMGEYFLNGFKSLAAKYPKLVKEVRGKGLICGMELNATPADKVEKFGPSLAILAYAQLVNKYHIQTLYSSNNANVFRMLPPLTITKEALDKAIAGMDGALADIAAMVGL